MAKTQEAARTLYLWDPEKQESHVYQQGEEVPAEHAKLATNPWCFKDPDNPEDLGDDRQRELEEMTVPDLVQYAKENDIDLQGATKKADIIQAIRNSDAALEG